MSKRSAIVVAAFACIAVCLTGCAGEKGATITGVVVEDGQPLRVQEKEAVLLSFVPTQTDDESNKSHPGAEFKRDDSSFTFVGPGKGLVPPGEYKVCLTVRPRSGTDRFAGEFSLEKTPLTFVVTDEPKHEIVIDVKKKTVSRR